MNYLALMLAPAMFGCASHLTTLERDTIRAETSEKYSICRAMYSKGNVPWIRNLSGSMRRHRDNPSALQMDMEMAQNGCRLQWD